MTITAHTCPGDEDKPNEDWYLATDDLVVVLDGATIRTDTGCIHGLPWFVRQLGGAIVSAAHDRGIDLMEALRQAIEYVASLHRDTCDLTHEGTPSTAVGIVRHSGERLEWLSLGDITILVETQSDVIITSDDRVSYTAIPERRECDRHLLGTDAKMRAIMEMKPRELAARNAEGGYWIASVIPEAAAHAYTGSALLTEVIRYAACSDGAMRAVEMTSINSPEAVLSFLHESGPESLIDRVRTAEHHDADGSRFPRNKQTDDATAVLRERGARKGRLGG